MATRMICDWCFSLFEPIDGAALILPLNDALMHLLHRREIVSKKNYIAFAKMFAEHRDTMSDNAFNNLLADVCSVFKQDNPRFDSERFIAACQEG